jgi:hypothetical protein
MIGSLDDVFCPLIFAKISVNSRMFSFGLFRITFYDQEKEA